MVVSELYLSEFIADIHANMFAYKVAAKGF